jgi:ketosteroid isomerase-like protein
MNHVATVQSIYAAFGRGDLPAILATLADDCDWDLSRPRLAAAATVPWMRRFRGKAEVPGFFAALGGTADVRVFSPEQFFADGDRVVVKVHEEYAVKSTGRALVMDAIHTFTFGPDGRVTAFRPIYDTAEAFAAYA